jgi:hypothetical protein
MTQTHHCRLCVMLVLAAFAGCGKSASQIAPVHGRVTLDGQPLPHTAVVFRTPGQSSSGGRTDENGNYELIYKRGLKGAPIGMNHVTILEDTQVTHKPQRVPARYNEESELEREVKAGDNEINFDLTIEAK